MDGTYGVVNVRKVMYRVHMVRSMDDAGLFRLNADVWLQHLLKLDIEDIAFLAESRPPRVLRHCVLAIRCAYMCN